MHSIMVYDVFNNNTGGIKMDKEEIRQWINENLVRSEEARTITGQSQSAFTQSVQSGKIVPFCTWGEGVGGRVLKLYDRESLELYARTKRKERK